MYRRKPNPKDLEETQYIPREAYTDPSDFPDPDTPDDWDTQENTPYPDEPEDYYDDADPYETDATPYYEEEPSHREPAHGSRTLRVAGIVAAAAVGTLLLVAVARSCSLSGEPPADPAASGIVSSESVSSAKAAEDLSWASSENAPRPKTNKSTPQPKQDRPAAPEKTESQAPQMRQSQADLPEKPAVSAAEPQSQATTPGDAASAQEKPPAAESAPALSQPAASGGKTDSGT